MTHILLPQPELYSDWKVWAAALARALQDDAEITIRVKSYAVANLPSPARVKRGTVVYVPDEVGGATLAFSDGVDWRRVQDRAVVS